MKAKPKRGHGPQQGQARRSILLGAKDPRSRRDADARAKPLPSTNSLQRDGRGVPFINAESHFEETPDGKLKLRIGAGLVVRNGRIEVE
jgi:hypothetical protein